LTPAEKTGLAALLLALFLSWFSPMMAVFPLSLFLISCLVAPFFPQTGFFLDVISRGNPANNQIALTFDDGPWPDSTPVVLDLLARYNLPATFFVVGKQAEKHPELIRSILQHGHTIGNHSLRHDPFLMLRTSKTLRRDIHATQEILQKSGITPLLFRPPAGITNPRLQKALATENLLAVTYSCRAMDGGNRYLFNLAEKILKRLRSGDIIMLHDLPPLQAELKDYWQKELSFLFATLQEKYKTMPLEILIQHPVMRWSEKNQTIP
jgi:peptidoglycan/xylan/chitin deacetylase (PgdA/CDA1 family)